jgi:hypothetical protein
MNLVNSARNLLGLAPRGKRLTSADLDLLVRKIEKHPTYRAQTVAERILDLNSRLHRVTDEIVFRATTERLSADPATVVNLEFANVPQDQLLRYQQWLNTVQDTVSELLQTNPKDSLIAEVLDLGDMFFADGQTAFGPKTEANYHEAAIFDCFNKLVSPKIAKAKLARRLRIVGYFVAGITAFGSAAFFLLG